MHFKQKLAYMAIGCLFTLAGYFLATLGAGGFNPQAASAQDTEKQVIDEIVCRKLRVVNPDGKTVAILEERIGGILLLRNEAGKDTFVAAGEVGTMYLYNKSGKKTFMASGFGSSLNLYHRGGEKVVSVFASEDGGELSINNKAGKAVVTAVALSEGDGTLAIYNRSREIAIIAETGVDSDSFVRVIGADGIGQLSGHSIAIFNNDKENIFEAGINKKDGGLIITSDKFGNETGRLPR